MTSQRNEPHAAWMNAGAEAVHAAVVSLLAAEGRYLSPQEELSETLLALGQYADHAKLDFSQALEHALEQHEEMRRKEPFAPGLAVVDGQGRRGVVLHSSGDNDPAYQVWFFDSATPVPRAIGEITLADFPTVDLTIYQVHSFARAMDELAELQHAVERAQQVGYEPDDSELTDREILLARLGEWTGLDETELLHHLRPRIAQHSEGLEAGASAPALAEADFPAPQPPTAAPPPALPPLPPDDTAGPALGNRP